MLISHDLAVVRQLTDDTIVLHNGAVVERGRTVDVLDNPQDDYTKLLRASVPHPGWKPVRQRLDEWRGSDGTDERTALPEATEATALFRHASCRRSS